MYHSGPELFAKKKRLRTPTLKSLPLLQSGDPFVLYYRQRPTVQRGRTWSSLTRIWCRSSTTGQPEWFDIRHWLPERIWGQMADFLRNLKVKDDNAKRWIAKTCLTTAMALIKRRLYFYVPYLEDIVPPTISPIFPNFNDCVGSNFIAVVENFLPN